MPKASSNPTQRPRATSARAAGEAPSRRDAVERALAIAVASLVAIAVLGFAGAMLHVAFRDGVDFFAGIVWQYAYWLPLLALPLAIICLVALVVVSATGKARRR